MQGHGQMQKARRILRHVLLGSPCEILACVSWHEAPLKGKQKKISVERGESWDLLVLAQPKWRWLEPAAGWGLWFHPGVVFPKIAAEAVAKEVSIRSAVSGQAEGARPSSPV